MNRYENVLEILVPFVVCLLLVLFKHVGESATIKTTLDAKYVRTDSLDTTKKIDPKNRIDEYNPRLSIKYSHPLTEWTDLSGEAKFDYKKENRQPEDDTETKEPQIELRLKSLIYDFKTGFKETRKLSDTDSRAFGHLLIQPNELPEIRMDYDHDERKDQYKKDKITLGTIYKPSRIMRIKLDFKHEYTNYLANDDIEDIDLSGEIKLNHTFSSRRPIKLDFSYKIESLYQEQKDANSRVNQDETLQTLRGKLSYKPTTRTDMSLEYENKKRDDTQGAQDNIDEDLQFAISQKLSDWLTATGRIRKETKEDRSETAPSSTKDTEKLALQGQIRAIPTQWFQLTFKVIDEEIEERDPNVLRKDKTVIETSLRSDFPNLLRSYQTLDFKTVNEDKVEGPFSEEERFMWKWSMNPLTNLSLKPEYIRSITENIKDQKKETTNEYKINLSYKISVNEVWTVNLSHVTSRKRIETEETDPNNPPTLKFRRENNEDSSLEVDFQPYESLFITSQITWKDYRIKSATDPSKSEEMSYSLKFDWSFNPFTWSTSYKYDDKNQSNDTETFESKIILDFSDYTIEGEYKFTQTFLQPPHKNKEDKITLRVKAVF